MILPVIMAGGSGSRLWPLSRKLNPKQFLSLCGEETLLQQTLSRLEGLSASNPLIICNEDHRFLVAEQLRNSIAKDANILLEPVGRNTAPAIALAALKATSNGEDPILLVLAADHFIHNTQKFLQAVKNGEEIALRNKLVTFGVVPTHPETGYGYIKIGARLSTNGSEVISFVEKPDMTTAQTYLDSKEYYWNSGIFMFKASVFLQNLKAFRPDILHACKKATKGMEVDMDFVRVNSQAFVDCPSESIDYAVMEKSSDTAVIELDAGWSDIGSWLALWEIGTKDQQGNVCKGDVLPFETNDSLIYSGNKLVVTLGVENLVVVETKDAVLVAHKNSVQNVKKIVDILKRDGRTEYINHREVYRPWGFYDSIDNGERYQVKRITVKPGAKISVQMHHHRAEHWIIVSGTAKVTIDDKIEILAENQSVYIPIGKIHSLENPGKILLELIEVQSGAYLGEDDIVRIHDIYGRN
ncbi:mannose-1-phosphate guanylyltransferase/mannose-6-phosphate isomerase [Psychrobacter sp. T6-1]|uniref:mannose-1-phosphate guanylyltransferase/mannose-6-phosphate isomerase n=1 Tax=Psychrobacter sp. T6-1 TaxID=3457447 RepID=UPI003FD0C977